MVYRKPNVTLSESTCYDATPLKKKKIQHTNFLTCQNIVAAVFVFCFVSCPGMFLTVNQLTVYRYLHVQTFDHKNNILHASLCYVNHAHFL